MQNPDSIDHLCIPSSVLLLNLDPLEVLGSLWRRVSSMGVTSSKLEKALSEFPGIFQSHICEPYDSCDMPLPTS